jgi:2-phospho-L-lactate guanylyltransferase
MGLDGAVSATSGWTVVLPVKSLAAAKSRMSEGHPTPAELALAFLRDTLSAVMATPAVAEVLVATRDPQVRALGDAAGATTIDDTGHDGINAAARWAAGHRTGSGGVGVVVSDLPCLTPASLAAVLDLAARQPTSFLGDLDGTGTTMWFTTKASTMRPAFGMQSRAAHLAAGDADLAALHPTSAALLRPARCDVDTAAALDRARTLGLGPASRLLLGVPVR